MQCAKVKSGDARITDEEEKLGRGVDGGRRARSSGLGLAGWLSSSHVACEHGPLGPAAATVPVKRQQAIAPSRSVVQPKLRFRLGNWLRLDSLSGFLESGCLLVRPPRPNIMVALDCHVMMPLNYG